MILKEKYISLLFQPINREKNYFIALGCEPKDARKWNFQTKGVFMRYLEDTNARAIGLIGLDGDLVKPNLDIQRRAFEEQLRTACSLEMTVILRLRPGPKKLDVFKCATSIVGEVSPRVRGNRFIAIWSRAGI